MSKHQHHHSSHQDRRRAAEKSCCSTSSSAPDAATLGALHRAATRHHARALQATRRRKRARAALARVTSIIRRGRQSDAPMPAGTIYTCPMHPEIRQVGPGNCPKCGMALEPELPSEHVDDSELRAVQRKVLDRARTDRAGRHHRDGASHARPRRSHIRPLACCARSKCSSAHPSCSGPRRTITSAAGWASCIARRTCTR